MTSEWKLRLFLTALMSLAISYRVFSIHKTEKNPADNDSSHQRYTPYIPCLVLPLSMILIIALELAFYGPLAMVKETVSLYFGIFVHISIYYLILLLLHSFLCKHISARASSMLWMLPNFLYPIYTQKTAIGFSHPLLVICLPKQILWSVFAIWVTGFLLILGYSLFSHICFRFRILKASSPVTDEAILSILKQELERAGIQKSYTLITSTAITTPLSIGLFHSSMLIVLPTVPYTQEELALIFRHELIHIGREDSWTKFFYVFCNAVCWFNPLMWTAMRKSAVDLELSCDETVLQNSDTETRYKYAALILNTADKHHGFTTCLSASVAALRYRLKNIMKPKKQSSGALIIGLVFFVLCNSYGYISLALENGNGAEVIYHSEKSEQYSLRRISISENTKITDFKCSDPDALYHYLSDMPLYDLQNRYQFDESEKLLTVSYNAPGGIMSITLSDHFAELVSPYIYGEGRTVSRYYLPDGMDWSYLDTLLQVSK